jgi:hypothetical protein
VYRFSDAEGRVIYVGKAKSLRSRLNSYFADPASLLSRTRSMVSTAARVDWTVVHNEVEALQLEYSWIKEFDRVSTSNIATTSPTLARSHRLRGVSASHGRPRGET